MDPVQISSGTDVSVPTAATVATLQTVLQRPLSTQTTSLNKRNPFEVTHELINNPILRGAVQREGPTDKSIYFEHAQGLMWWRAFPEVVIIDSKRGTTTEKHSLLSSRVDPWCFQPEPRDPHLCLFDANDWPGNCSRSLEVDSRGVRKAAKRVPDSIAIIYSNGFGQQSPGSVLKGPANGSGAIGRAETHSQVCKLDCQALYEQRLATKKDSDEMGADYQCPSSDFNTKPPGRNQAVE